uniref:ATP synthase F0 subunit 8 n=1 Tax=Agenioideus sp. SJW-2017 TaxID=1940100 RepID=A0A1P8VH73_9HYME|nr:ATP synthase F0 subunit 8 [Agenioideus sp. SJW-2017]
MPQMSPLYWLCLYMMFIIIFSIFSSCMYMYFNVWFLDYKPMFMYFMKLRMIYWFKTMNPTINKSSKDLLINNDLYLNYYMCSCSELVKKSNYYILTLNYCFNKKSYSKNKW